MAGHPFVLVEALHTSEGDAHVDGLVYQLVGHAVVIGVDGYVVVDVGEE